MRCREAMPSRWRTQLRSPMNDHQNHKLEIKPIGMDEDIPCTCC